MTQFQGTNNPNPLYVPPDLAAKSAQQALEDLGLRGSSIQNSNPVTNSIESQIAQTNARIEKFYDDLINETGGMKYRDPITSNISRQMAHIADMNFYSRPTRFYFEIEGLGWPQNERLVRNCQNTVMPGRALQTQPLKIYGPPIEYAYEANYANELQMTFRVGEDLFERDFFEGWMGSVYSPMTGDLLYPDTYMTNMRIYQLDRRDLKVYCTELYNVFCKNISDIELSTDATDQITTINVTLAYSEYQVVGKRNFPYYVRKDRGETEETTTIRSKIQDSISQAEKVHQVRLDRGVQRAGDIRNEVREALNRNN
jgi:hypothetical protein